MPSLVCMFMRWNLEEFEHAWHDMVGKMGLHTNRWVMKIYGKQKKWVKAYLQG